MLLCDKPAYLDVEASCPCKYCVRQRADNEELKRYREREPLVQELLTAAANLITQEGCALPIEVQVRDLDDARMELEQFKLSASEEADGS